MPRTHPKSALRHAVAAALTIVAVIAASCLLLVPASAAADQRPAPARGSESIFRDIEEMEKNYMHSRGYDISSRSAYFDTIDRSPKDGFLSVAELMMGGIAGLPQDEQNRFLKFFREQVDRDGDGHISRDEFLNANPDDVRAHGLNYDPALEYDAKTDNAWAQEHQWNDENMHNWEDSHGWADDWDSWDPVADHIRNYDPVRGDGGSAADNVAQAAAHAVPEKFRAPARDGF